MYSKKVLCVEKKIGGEMKAMKGPLLKSNTGSISQGGEGSVCVLSLWTPEPSTTVHTEEMPELPH